MRRRSRLRLRYREQPFHDDIVVGSIFQYGGYDFRCDSMVGSYGDNKVDVRGTLVWEGKAAVDCHCRRCKGRSFSLSFYWKPGIIGFGQRMIEPGSLIPINLEIFKWTIHRFFKHRHQVLTPKA